MGHVECFKLMKTLSDLYITYLFLHVTTRGILTAGVQIHEEDLEIWLSGDRA